MVAEVEVEPNSCDVAVALIGHQGFKPEDWGIKRVFSVWNHTDQPIAPKPLQVDGWNFCTIIFDMSCDPSDRFGETTALKRRRVGHISKGRRIHHRRTSIRLPNAVDNTRGHIIGLIEPCADSCPDTKSVENRAGKP